MDLGALGLYDDSAIVDDTVTVTLTRPASYAGGDAASVTVQEALEEASAEQRTDSPMGGVLDGTRRSFHLWLSQCGSLPPQMDYLITKADATVWVIKEVNVLDQGRRFLCHCVQRNDTTP